jgi:hypothetical protein
LSGNSRTMLSRAGVVARTSIRGSWQTAGVIRGMKKKGAVVKKKKGASMVEEDDGSAASVKKMMIPLSARPTYVMPCHVIGPSSHPSAPHRPPSGSPRTRTAEGGHLAVLLCVHAVDRFSLLPLGEVSRRRGRSLPLPVDVCIGRQNRPLGALGACRVHVGLCFSATVYIFESRV